MALTTNTDEKDNDSTEEHIFPPYQDRNTTFRIDKTNIKRGYISGKDHNKLDPVQAFAIAESRNIRDSPLDDGATGKNFVNSRKSHVISQSNTP